jgi:uncharacterized protein
MHHFSVKGHPEVRGTHKTTLEFTKDTHLTPRGDCIIGTAATFSGMRGLQGQGKLVLTVPGETPWECFFHFNPQFSSEHEIVIRMGDYASERTLGIRSDKAAQHVPRSIIKKLQDPTIQAEVIIEELA